MTELIIAFLNFAKPPQNSSRRIYIASPLPKIIHSMVEKKETVVDSENHEEHTQKLYGKNTELLNIKLQSVTSVLGMGTFNKGSCN